MNEVLEESNIMEERFIAFLDILGFTETIRSIESDNSKDNPNLIRIKSILNFMNEESEDPNYSADLPIYTETADGLLEKELGDPRLTYVSDCIIISSEPTLDGFKGLSRKIHKITSDLAFDGVFCRGAITKGKIFHHGKVLFGTSYIKAYKLEGKLAKFPRVIIDPDIIEFFDLQEGKMPLAPAFYGLDTDGLYYQRYFTWQMFLPYAYSFHDYLLRVREWIATHLSNYKETPNIFEKYQWIACEFNSLVEGWGSLGDIDIEIIEYET